jgi:hypothetical protein
VPQRALGRHPFDRLCGDLCDSVIAGVVVQHCRTVLFGGRGDDEIRQPEMTVSAPGRQCPGLADPSGVSFESVNHPGRYLRQRPSLLYLEAADTPAAHADATFHLD